MKFQVIIEEEPTLVNSLFKSQQYIMKKPKPRNTKASKRKSLGRRTVLSKVSTFSGTDQFQLILFELNCQTYRLDWPTIHGYHTYPRLTYQGAPQCNRMS